MRSAAVAAILTTLLAATAVSGCNIRVGEVAVPESWKDNYRGGRINPPAGR